MASTQSPYFISQQQEEQPPYNSNNTPQEQSFNFNSKVSPSILLIIVILAVIFFVSGLLHLLVRFLLRPGGAARRRGGRNDDDDAESVSALQGQLQQLFHLHDAGVDQSFIDSLPVFQYTSITGSDSAKRPFDCAVCLCEFEPLDKLRLLPKCSHAFHTECIDTWLLSHSTCPLCRASLLFSAANANANANADAENCSPIVLVLESGSSNASAEITTTQEFTRNEEPTSLRELIISEQRESIVTVKLGKFTSLDGGGGGGGEGASSSASVSMSVSNSVDSRRCFSMGSFAYVMDESSNLRVPIRMPSVKKASKSTISSLPGPKAGMIARAAMSECDCESRREFEFNAVATPAVQGLNNNSAEISKKESFSISKIWLRGKKEKDTNTSGSSCSVECSRRAFSFRFQRSVINGNGNGNGGVSGEDLKGKNGKFPRRTVSEIGVARWEREGVEMDLEEESQSCNSLDSQSNPPSFARKTLLWLMGRQQNKVVHSSFDPNNP